MNIDLIPGVDGVWLIRRVLINIFIIKTDNGFLIVDTGLPRFFQSIKDAIIQLGFQKNELSSIILTHAHFDHFGSAAYLKTWSGASVSGHFADVPFYEKGGIGILPGYIGFVSIFSRTMLRSFLHADPVKIDQPLQDGDQIGEWTVIHTPGHTPGTICLHSQSRKILIAGNWISSARQPDRPIQGLPRFGFLNLNQKQVRESCQKIARLDFDKLLCSHGPMSFFPAYARLVKSWKD